MAYEIKSPLWGVKPGKRETRQPVLTGAEVSGDFSISYKRQIMDTGSPFFINPSMNIVDFKPFAKELIETGTVVLDASKGRMFMWSMPPFSFELSQAGSWKAACPDASSLQIIASGYSVLLNPYIYITDVTRISIGRQPSNDLYFRLSYMCLTGSYTILVKYSGCRTFKSRGGSSSGYYSLQSGPNYADWSATNCITGLTLPQLTGVEKADKNGFLIQSDGVLSPGIRSNTFIYRTYLTGNMFVEGTTSIRARVFLPELFAPVADQPAILTASAPVISGCIVCFVKNTV